MLTFINNELDGSPEQRESLMSSTSASFWVLFDQQERTRQNLMRISLKDRRGDQRGVNESQSKFLSGTWPISQNQPETPLF
jgi:hypothetical protein